MAIIYDIEQSSKEFFFRAYQKARIYAFSPAIIRKGWRATDIWPRDRQKAKNSRLVAKNNNLLDSTVFSTSGSFLINSELAVIVLKTLHSSRQIRYIEGELRGLSEAYRSSTVRLLFRKFCKGLDKLSVRTATAEAKRKVFVVALDYQKPRKQCRVLPDPNQVFVDIVAIGKERKAIGLAEKNPPEIIENDKSSDDDEVMEMECIEIRKSDTESSLSD